MITTALLASLIITNVQNEQGPQYIYYALPKGMNPTAISDSGTIGAESPDGAVILKLDRSTGEWTSEKSPYSGIVNQIDSNGRILAGGVISNSQFEVLIQAFPDASKMYFRGLGDNGTVLGVHFASNSIGIAPSNVVLPWLMRQDGSILKMSIPAGYTPRSARSIQINHRGQSALLADSKNIDDVTGKIYTVTSVLYYDENGDYSGANVLPPHLSNSMTTSAEEGFDDSGNYFLTGKNANTLSSSHVIGYCLTRNGVLSHLSGAIPNSTFWTLDSNSRIAVGTIPRTANGSTTWGRAAVLALGQASYDLNDLCTNLPANTELIAASNVNKDGVIIGQARIGKNSKNLTGFVAFPTG